MSIADEIQRLDELHRSGALSLEEFELAKQRVLEGDADYEASEHLEEIKAQNAIAQLDREWEMERENYMVTGKYGARYKPSRGGSLVGGIVVAVFGAFWTLLAGGMAAGGIVAGAPAGLLAIFPLFGVLFIVLGVGGAIHSFAKANRYDKAQQRYQRRRRELLGASQDWPEQDAAEQDWPEQELSDDGGQSVYRDGRSY